MIVSTHSGPHRSEFDVLLNSTIDILNEKAKHSSKVISELKGDKLEPFVTEIMMDQAVGTPFQNNIFCEGKFKFPDIIARIPDFIPNNYYGIEVKTTTQNHWKTTGNSVLETTRIEGIERIFMLFGKLSAPIEFKCRPYEDCLSEVVVTHSPRYLIDMNLAPSKTIFDKLNIPYDVLRKEKNPIKSIVDHYRKKLKPGEDVWWMDSDSKSTSMSIKILNKLEASEKQRLLSKCLILFPEILSNSNTKYDKVAVWLIKSEGVVCSNLRDSFSASGKPTIVTKYNTYDRVPKIFKVLIDNISLILNQLNEMRASELSEYWGTKTTEKTKILDWIERISLESRKIKDAKHFDLKQIINEMQ